VDDSLSIIVPVRNVETTIAGRVEHLLEILPDVTVRFEIIVVDDGSTDHTVDAARELARQYPQLRVIAHREPQGREAAAKTGLASAHGQTVFIQEDSAALSAAQLRRLWSLRTDRQVVMAHSQQRAGVFDPELLERLSTWCQMLREASKRNRAGAVRMIRRDAAQLLSREVKTQRAIAREGSTS